MSVHDSVCERVCSWSCIEFGALDGRLCVCVCKHECEKEIVCVRVCVTCVGTHGTQAYQIKCQICVHCLAESNVMFYMRVTYGFALNLTRVCVFVCVRVIV